MRQSLYKHYSFAQFRDRSRHYKFQQVGRDVLPSLNITFWQRKRLTPYKLKMLLYPQLIESGHIITPWNEMCQVLEKSNHIANKAFQSKTMRGGGKQSTQEPFLSFNSPCRSCSGNYPSNQNKFQLTTCYWMPKKLSPSPIKLAKNWRPTMMFAWSLFPALRLLSVKHGTRNSDFWGCTFCSG